MRGTREYAVGISCRENKQGMIMEAWEAISAKDSYGI